MLCTLPLRAGKSKLIDFTSDTYHYFKSIKYLSAYFALGGDNDINDWKVELLLNLFPIFNQIVNLATRGSKTLSDIATDLWGYFQNPEILPPQQPDVLGVGKPSDHCVRFAITFLGTNTRKRKISVLKIIRPFPESGVSEFRGLIVAVDFLVSLQL